MPLHFVGIVEGEGEFIVKDLMGIPSEGELIPSPTCGGSTMPNDARLGLVVGVTLVILVAILFSRKDGPMTVAPGAVRATPPSSTNVGLTAPVPGLPGVPARSPPTRVIPRTHTVGDGETLMSLAVLYYGDAGHVSFLFRANQDRILAPDRVPIGTVLRIPDLPTEVATRVEK
jgi:nucleoid-associated protein YgaU